MPDTMPFLPEANLQSSIQEPLRVANVRGVRPVPAPEWLTGADGRLATMFPRLDTSKGQVHVIVPSGQGDVAWLWSKYWKLDEDLKAQGRELIWHFPDDNVRRVGPYAELVGMNVGEWLRFDIKQLLEQPGEFEPADFETGCVVYLHANRHIEDGNPLHDRAPKYDPVSNNKVWHPWLPFKNPAPEARIITDTRPPQTSENQGVWKMADKSKRAPYFVVHMASPNYCEGNYFPRKWAQMLEKMEKYAPVRLVGLEWDRGMIEAATEYYTPRLPVCINQPLATVLSLIANSSGMIGVDSGLTIFGTYYGIPALRAYPRWLHLMPGTFEDPDTLHPHNKAIFMDELWDELPGWLEGLEVV